MPHVPLIKHAILWPLYSPIFTSYSTSLYPKLTPTLTPWTATTVPESKEVPTFAVLRQFRVAEQVTCHNSGKSLWLDLKANSWHGMVEWQRQQLTLPSPLWQKPWWGKVNLTTGPNFNLRYFRMLSHIKCTLHLLIKQMQKQKQKQDSSVGK